MPQQKIKFNYHCKCPLPPNTIFNCSGTEIITVDTSINLKNSSISKENIIKMLNKRGCFLCEIDDLF